MQCKRRKWIIQCYVIYFFSCVFKQLIGVRIRDIPNNLLLLFPNMEFIIEVFVTFPRTACALVWCVMIYYPTLLIYMLSFSFRVAQSKWMTLGSTTEKQNTITSGHITCVCKNTNMELFTVRHFFFFFFGNSKSGICCDGDGTKNHRTPTTHTYAQQNDISLYRLPISPLLRSCHFLIN